MADKEEQDDILEYNEYETIVFEENRTIITKNNESEDTLSKAELNQCAEEMFPDNWIVEHRALIDSIYRVLNDILWYSEFGQNVTLTGLTDYLDFVHHNDTTDTCEWNIDVIKQFEVKFKCKRKPKFKTWVQCNLYELFDVWDNLMRSFSNYIGGFETFMEFMYEYS